MVENTRIWHHVHHVKLFYSLIIKFICCNLAINATFDPRRSIFWFYNILLFEVSLLVCIIIVLIRQNEWELNSINLNSFLFIDNFPLSFFLCLVISLVKIKGNTLDNIICQKTQISRLKLLRIIHTHRKKPGLSHQKHESNDISHMNEYLTNNPKHCATRPLSQNTSILQAFWFVIHQYFKRITIRNRHKKLEAAIRQLIHPKWVLGEAHNNNGQIRINSKDFEHAHDPTKGSNLNLKQFSIKADYKWVGMHRHHQHH